MIAKKNIFKFTFIFAITFNNIDPSYLLQIKFTLDTIEALAEVTSIGVLINILFKPFLELFIKFFAIRIGHIIFKSNICCIFFYSFQISI